MRFATAVLVVAAVAGADGWAQSRTRGPLNEVRSLKCSFPAAATTEWRNGAPVTVTANEEFGFEIDTINIQRRTARIVGSRGTAEASAFLTDTSLNVIEQTPIGNFILTSIFTAGGDGTRLMAVHSRHLGDLAAPPSASQYYGTCDVVK
jgi:hypothetical protein